MSTRCRSGCGRKPSRSKPRPCSRASVAPSRLTHRVSQSASTARLDVSKWSLTGSKKVRDEPIMMRQEWIDMNADVATTRQCKLAGVSRATVYAHQKPKVADADDLLLSRLIDEEYTRHPFYGTRRMVVIVSRAVGYRVNRQACATPDAPDGLSWHGTWPQHQSGSSAAPGLPVLAARLGDYPAQPSLEHRHHLHPLCPRLCVLGGRDGLVQPQGIELAHQQHHASQLLRGLSGRGTTQLR